MKESPIIFSTPMVQAILEERKTQTRRIIKPQPNDVQIIAGRRIWDPEVIECPFGEAGDLLWVRETWLKYNLGGTNYFYYKATSSLNQVVGASPNELDWKPSIHLKKEHARLWLQIENIRVERLQDISEEDAKAEGAPGYTERNYPLAIHDKYPTAKQDFIRLWQDINGQDSFSENPFVWVIEFKELSRTGKPTVNSKLQTAN